MDKQNSFEDIFYGAGADFNLKFKDKKSIKVNKALLANRHSVFYEILFKNSKKDHLQIKDFDSDTFKRFLDCFMGFNDCTNADALIILPVALKYQLDDFSSNLIKLLQPKELDEDFCIFFNAAVSLFLATKTLDDDSNPVLQSLVLISSFLTENYRLYKFLDMENLCALLNSDSMLFLLNKVEKGDSWIYRSVLNWAENYVKKSKKKISLRQFLEESGILNKISFDHFESLESLLNFTSEPPGKDVFTDTEILNYLRNKCLASKKSEWSRNVESLTETFNTLIHLPEGYRLNISIFRNDVIFYEMPASGKKEDLKKIQVELLFSGNDETDNYFRKTFNELDEQECLGEISFGNLLSNTEETLEKEFITEIILPRKHYFEIELESSENHRILRKITVKYTFGSDGRTLMSSPKFTDEIDCEPNKLYFTSDITFKISKIGENTENTENGRSKLEKQNLRLKLLKQQQDQRIQEQLKEAAELKEKAVQLAQKLGTYDDNTARNFRLSSASQSAPKIGENVKTCKVM